MKISVIVPVYNTEKYLNRCIDSILAQTFTDFELLLIDDGSTDSSGKICDEYALKDKRVKVFHKENGGVSRARNLGIDNAQGEYLSFIDSDDYIRPEMYEKLAKIIDIYGVDLVCSNLEQNGKVLANKTPQNRVIDKQEIHDKILPYFTENDTLGAGGYTTMLIKRSVLEKGSVRFYEDFAFQEDTMFMINVYGNISLMYYLPQTFYEYTTHPTGLYTAYRKGDGVNFIKARNIMLSLIEKYDIPANFFNFNSTYLYNVGWYIYRTLRLKDKKEKNSLIDGVLLAEETKDACVFLADNATSFDKRIAKAICKGKKRKVIFLIKFVYSGKAAKLQKFIAKLRGNR
ncbi:MAG: glycosyltransferase family 2 protein [Clostridia bacterium]|nr:glycosyltransferase family 2 protein [Clostridia bacterium]